MYVYVVSDSACAYVNSKLRFNATLTLDTLDPQHDPLAFGPMTSLDRWSFTPRSEYVGELHPDGISSSFFCSTVRIADGDRRIGTPLTYAPALGVPLSLTDPRFAPDPNVLASRLRLQLPLVMPNYQAWDPIRVLHAYDMLSGTPYTEVTARVEAELLQTPLSDEVYLDHRFRVLTLERWWQVKNTQRHNWQPLYA
ncbi:MAG: hypothetical protein LQ338_006468 [Usnochroma carphineum]|nr:MAG: hypothetical protein LQ338_006468 [Usnochroma carphineum]